MRFLILVFTLVNLAIAATLPSGTGTYVKYSFAFPDESIDGNYTLSDDQVPFISSIDGKTVVLIVNGTSAENAAVSNNISLEELEKSAPSLDKREAKFHWLTYNAFQPINKKREAAPEAKFHWLTYNAFQPINKKREAAPEAKFHWLTYNAFQPINKREAAPEAKFHWLTYNAFQPINKKREAAPEAKFHWLTYNAFQPIN